MGQLVFSVGGVDFSGFIAANGIRWERNDIDAAGSGRDQMAVMRRLRIASKVKLSITCRNLTQEQMRAINAALSPEMVEVTYLDPRSGARSAVFYGSSVESTTIMDMGNSVIWQSPKFNLIEV